MLYNFSSIVIQHKLKLSYTECKIVSEQQYSHVAVTGTGLEQQTQLSWRQTNC